MDYTQDYRYKTGLNTLDLVQRLKLKKEIVMPYHKMEKKKKKMGKKKKRKMGRK